MQVPDQVKIHMPLNCASFHTVQVEGKATRRNFKEVFQC